MAELSIDAARAAEAFRHDPKSRRMLRRVWGSRLEFFPAELFVRTVLAYLGEDPRSWHDWQEIACAGADLVIHEEGWRRRRVKKRRLLL